MSAYYYTVAALPALLYDEQPALNYTDFMEFLNDQLSLRDLAELERVHPETTESFPEDKPSLGRWKQWERSLRNELVRYRAGRKKRDPEDFFRAGEESLDPLKTAKEAVEAENPLEAEERMDKARWLFLEELEAGHYFDLEKLLIYALKLQLLERKNLRTREEGIKNFSGILEKVESKNEK